MSLCVIWPALFCGQLAAQPVEAPGAPPKSVDMRPELDRLGLTPRQQGARPTCSVFTVVGAIELAVAKQQNQSPRLSVEFLNWAANKVCGDREDGAYFSDLWRGFEAHGLCAEKEMPYRAALDATLQPTLTAVEEAKTRLTLGLRLHWIKEWDVKTGLTDDHLAAIKRTLAEGWPVCAGLRWPKKEQWVEGVLQMCPPDAVRDGHSVLLVGCRDEASQPGGGVFVFRNTSGAGRDGMMPYAYAQAYMNDAAWVDFESRRMARTGPTAALPASPASVER